jgi:hypothetical protein
VVRIRRRQFLIGCAFKVFAVKNSKAKLQSVFEAVSFVVAFKIEAFLAPFPRASYPSNPGGCISLVCRVGNAMERSAEVVAIHRMGQILQVDLCI